jgi:predicted TIM-barrel fold metal-dependent hydrolase
MGHADLLLGEAVEEVLAAHEAVGRGLFRGVRFTTAQDDYKPLRMGLPAGVMKDQHYLTGVRTLGRLGYTYDAFCYHPQMPELIEALGACPDVTVVVNHLCGPVGVGPYKDRRAEIMPWWRQQMTALAGLPNVTLKLGGIGMPMFGIRWDRQERPPTSQELAAPWRDEIRHCIDAFGPNRCMFESNFPVDKRGCSYQVLWNTFKRISADYTPSEKRDLFHDTAARAYGIRTIA